ncbi:MAG: hypothetical protein ACK4UN_01570 [Limisphaerales bacterium]
MNNGTGSDEGIKGDLPPTFEVVLVHTSKYRCAAYRDNEGRWWSRDHYPISEPILKWEPL